MPTLGSTIRFDLQIAKQPWTVICASGLPSFLGTAAVTIGRTCRVKPGIAPDSQSLLSWSVGRIWGSDYWRKEERDADAYGLVMRNDPTFLIAATTVRAGVPSNWPTVTVTHPT